MGPVIPGGEVKIAADGEILYRGPNVMMGYYHRPELTSEAIDADGWLHTGDVGEFDGIFLKITDRKKEMFKTSGGKYIAPQQVENRMKESRFIAQIMIVGENRKFPAALIVPAFETVADHFRQRRVHWRSNCEIVANPEVNALDRIRNPAIERAFRTLLAGQEIRTSEGRMDIGRWRVDADLEAETTTAA